jgi:predicted nucleic acid-binding protein
VAYLIDTSILGRLANSSDVAYPVALGAVVELHRRSETLCLTPQVLIEFRGVATRPVPQNGLGLSSAEAATKSAIFESAFLLLDESPDIYPAWKSLVTALAVSGKQVHDARLAAVCHAHRISHILTFNGAHFARLAGFGPGLVVVDPSRV